MSNIKELIRAEIERQMKYYDEKEQKAWDDSDALWYQGHQKMCAKLLSFLDTLPDEPVTDCNEFEEAKEEYLRKARRTPGHEWMTHDIEDAFKAGAEWQKRKMMEGAVEGFIFQSEDYYPKQLIAGYDGELGMGDKVKIIIVKEGEQ